MPDFLDSQYKAVIESITDGRVVLLLSASVNLYGRSAGVVWRCRQYLPNSSELLMEARLDEIF